MYIKSWSFGKPVSDFKLLLIVWLIRWQVVCVLATVDSVLHHVGTHRLVVVQTTKKDVSYCWQLAIASTGQISHNKLIHVCMFICHDFLICSRLQDSHLNCLPDNSFDTVYFILSMVNNHGFMHHTFACIWITPELVRRMNILVHFAANEHKLRQWIYGFPNLLDKRVNLKIPAPRVEIQGRKTAWALVAVYTAY